MHAAFGQRSEGGSSTATWHASFPEPRPNPTPPPAPVVSIVPMPDQSAGFAAQRNTNWIAIAFILAAHVLLLFALVKFDVISIAKPKSKPLVVDLVMLPADPPPVTSPPEQDVAPPASIAPAIVTPKAVVPTPAPAPMLAVTQTPPPPRAVIVAPAAPAAPMGPVSVDDLSSRMVSATPPKYPVESRRRKEQGTVFLTVLVGTDGSVAEINVSRSSGSARLDKAALEAVRRWRWSPVKQAGMAVMVRGIVDIPFVLQG